VLDAGTTVDPKTVVAGLATDLLTKIDDAEPTLIATPRLFLVEVLVTALEPFICTVAILVSR
jgi:hypothetical protein